MSSAAVIGRQLRHQQQHPQQPKPGAKPPPRQTLPGPEIDRNKLQEISRNLSDYYPPPEVIERARDRLKDGEEPTLQCTPRCMCIALKALSGGILLFTAGTIMSAIGFFGHGMYADDHGHVSEDNATTLNNLTYVGPVVMGLGGIMVVAACILTFEVRDTLGIKEPPKQVDQRDKPKKQDLKQVVATKAKSPATPSAAAQQMITTISSNNLNGKVPLSILSAEPVVSSSDAATPVQPSIQATATVNAQLIQQKRKLSSVPESAKPPVHPHPYHPDPVVAAAAILEAETKVALIEQRNSAATAAVTKRRQSQTTTMINREKADRRSSYLEKSEPVTTRTRSHARGGPETGRPFMTETSSGYSLDTPPTTGTGTSLSSEGGIQMIVEHHHRQPHGHPQMPSAHQRPAPFLPPPRLTASKTLYSNLPSRTTGNITHTSGNLSHILGQRRTSSRTHILSPLEISYFGLPSPQETELSDPDGCSLVIPTRWKSSRCSCSGSIDELSIDELDESPLRRPLPSSHSFRDRDKGPSSGQAGGREQGLEGGRGRTHFTYTSTGYRPPLGPGGHSTTSSTMSSTNTTTVSTVIRKAKVLASIESDGLSSSSSCSSPSASERTVSCASVYHVPVSSGTAASADHKRNSVVTLHNTLHLNNASQHQHNNNNRT